VPTFGQQGKFHDRILRIQQAREANKQHALALLRIQLCVMAHEDVVAPPSYGLADNPSQILQRSVDRLALESLCLLAPRFVRFPGGLQTVGTVKKCEATA
jgi:hypothetical protein